MTKARNIADLGSNDVIETTATGVDVTGTVTADGLTVDGNSNLGVEGSGSQVTMQLPSLSSSYPTRLVIEGDYNSGTSDVDIKAIGVPSGGPYGANLNFYTSSQTSVLNRMKIANNGDVSFYEDTGTTAKMVWSSSAESLTVDGSVRFGYNEGAETDVINWVKGSNNALVFESTSNPDYASGSWGGLQFHSANGYGGQLAGIAVSHRYGDATERQYADGMSFLLKNGGSADNWVEAMALRSSGYVGIGTYNPASKLHVRGPGNPTLTIDGSDGAYTSFLTMKAAGAGASVIRAEGGTNSLVLQTNGDNERARIDSSGNLLVGTTSSKGQAGKLVANGGSATSGTRAVTETICQGASGTFSKVEITFAGNNDNSTGIMDVQLASFNERAADYCVMQYSTGSTNQMRSNVTGFSVAITGTPNSTGSVWKMTITGTMTHPVVTAKCTVGGLATGFSSAPVITYA